MPKYAFFQPAQRPTKTVAPSVSMVQLKSAPQNTHGPRKAVSKASMSAYVYKDNKDLQKEKSNPAPTGPTQATSEDLPIIQASQAQAQAQAQAQPSTAVNLDTKQEPLTDLTSSAPETSQLEQGQIQDKQQPSGQSDEEKFLQQKLAYALISDVNARSPSSPHFDEDITEPLYVDAVEHLNQEQIDFLTNAKEQFLNLSPPPPDSYPVRLPEPLVLEHCNPTRTSSAQSEVNLNQSHTGSAFQALPCDPPYLSEFEDDEDDYYNDDRGYTTTHSYRSRGDNTTDGVTTIMIAPKLTKKGLAEIEAARQFVDSKRTTEEIQEDAWDVSMVAEYGDEIFQYMKEQEVRYNDIPVACAIC
jgi:hypothetical protein